MYDILISLVVTLIGIGAWGLVLFVTEMRCAQRGQDTWGWAKRIYANSPRIQYIRW